MLAYPDLAMEAEAGAPSEQRVTSRLSAERGSAAKPSMSFHCSSMPGQGGVSPVLRMTPYDDYHAFAVVFTYIDHCLRVFKQQTLLIYALLHPE